jgi:hypothetical protein
MTSCWFLLLMTSCWYEREGNIYISGFLSLHVCEQRIQTILRTQRSLILVKNHSGNQKKEEILQLLQNKKAYKTDRLMELIWQTKKLHSFQRSVVLIILIISLQANIGLFRLWEHWSRNCRGIKSKLEITWKLLRYLKFQ